MVVVQTNYNQVLLQLNSWRSWIDFEWRSSWVGVEMELGVELELDNSFKIFSFTSQVFTSILALAVQLSEKILYKFRVNINKSTLHILLPESKFRFYIKI